MADPLSIIASVVGIGGAAVSASRGLYELVNTIQNAPEQIATTSKDLHSFYTIVSSLHSALQDNDVKRVVRDDFDLTAMVGNLEEPLRSCTTVLGLLMVKIQGHLKPGEDGRGLRMSSVDLKWYFTKKEVKELMERLEASKATLDTALTAVGTLCSVRLMAANLKAGRSLRRGSTDTDAGYALRRYVAETTDGSNTIVPSSPQLNPSSGTDMWLEESPALMPFEKAPASRIPTPEPIDPVERLRKAESQRNALHDAAKKGDDLIVQRLIAEGADINVKDVDGKTALHFAAEEGNESVAQILLEHGADVNAKSLARGIMERRKFVGGRTPLHWAASHGHEGIIRILLDYKADVAAANVTKRTALQEALGGRNIEAARLLIDNGAPLVCHDDEGWTPLHEAASKGCLEIQRILVDKGVDIDAVTTDRNIWHNPRFSHATPLLLAANGGHPACVRHLINHGANIKAVNAGGEMAIHTGAVDGRINIVRMMLDAGVDIETRDLRFNETPLLKAASTGRSAVIMLLLERGADASATTQIGRDALRHAQLHQRGNDEAVEILKNHLSNPPTRS